MLRGLGSGNGVVERRLTEIRLRLLRYFQETAPSVLHLMIHPSFGPRAVARGHKHISAPGLAESLVNRIRSLEKEGRVAKLNGSTAGGAFIATVHGMAVFNSLSGIPRGEDDRGRVRDFVRICWHGLMPR